MAKKIILDVDTGTDDAVAIMLAALHRDLDSLRLPPSMATFRLNRLPIIP
jgi:hypothetical protein